MDIIVNISNSMYPDRKGTNWRLYWQESFANGNDLTLGGVLHSWMSTWDMTKAVDTGIYTIRS